VSWAALIAAFGGGLLGAAIGAVPAFIFTGVLAIAGVAAAAAGGTELIGVAFGPVLGPHISFGGGVAAAAYAGSRGFIKTGRDIGSPLMGVGRSDVLLVGGLFGCVGWLVNQGLTAAGGGAWTDTIALTVVLTGMAARVIFGKKSLFGTVSTPNGRRFRPDDSATWLPWQQDFAHVVPISIGVGLMSAYLAGSSGLRAGGDILGFGISTTILIFLIMGQKVPVTHHMALPAALAIGHGGGLLLGAACGLAGGLLGEVASRVFLIHGDTHIDPPAAGIAVMATLLHLAAFAGFLPR
jgi:hypothetical protein